MKRFSRPLVLAGLLLQAAAANATIIQFTTPLGLSGAQEVPAHATPGFGNGSVSYDTVSLLLDVQLTWADLLAPATAAHIHCCSGPGANAAVAINFVPVGFPAATSGSFSHSFDLTQTASYGSGFLAAFGGDVNNARAAFVAGLSADMAYFNIHTQVFPGGEIRGDITQTRLPEPATLGLLGIGLGLAALSGKGTRRASR